MTNRSTPAAAQESVTTPSLLVSLGLPVYNGQNYLREALDCILAQTYGNWELILSDNGSTDATPRICEEYAARDPRIRYYSQGRNIGATRNFNFTFEKARGSLFRWTSHDDLFSPDLLARSVEAMSAHPEAVLCHPRTRIIGPVGEPLYDYNVRLRTDSPAAPERFLDLICVDHGCFPIFGVMRSHKLRATPLLETFVGSDRNLLAELALHGSFHEIPEILFYRRDHPMTSTRQFPDANQRIAWFQASLHRKDLLSRLPSTPTLRRAMGYLTSILRVEMGIEDRLGCLGALSIWTGHRLASAERHMAASLAHVLRTPFSRLKSPEARPSPLPLPPMPQTIATTPSSALKAHPLA